MKGKIFSIITALVLCLILLPGTAGAEEPIEGGLDLVGQTTQTVEDQEAGWKWEPNSDSGGTLTLTNCHLKGNIMGNDNKTLLPFVIRFPDLGDGEGEYEIVLEGDNILESTAPSTYGAMISVDGADLKQYRITGTGSLTFLMPPGGANVNAPYAIAGSGNCSILIEEGVTIRSNVDLCVINRDVILRGGSVTLEGEYVTYGVYTNAGDVIIESGDLTVNASMTGIFLPGLPPTTRTNNVKISGGTVTITAPASAVHINHQNDGQAGEKIEITGGEVNLNSGARAFQGKEITVGENAKLNVSVTDGPGLLVPEGRTVKLAAGTYSGSGTAVKITAPDVSLMDLLVEGCAFYDENDQLIALAEDQTELPGTVTVKTCTHDPSVCTYTQTEGETHSVICRACGKTEAAENCTYEYESVDETNHKGVCKCGREKTEAHTLDSKWLPNYNKDTVTIVHACTAECGYSKQDGIIQVPNDVRIAYGASCELEIITTGLENAVVEWTGDGTFHENPYTPADLTVGEHSFHFAVRWDGSGDNPFTGFVHVEVVPASLSGAPTFGSGQGKALKDVEVILPENWPAGSFQWSVEDDSQQVVQGQRYFYVFTSADGNYQAEGSAVLWPGQLETDLKVEAGISEVPEGLKDIFELNTPAKLESAMLLKVTQAAPEIPAQNTTVYDVTLMVSTDGGQSWAPATKENFPANGRLTVTLPYPAGTDRTDRFTVVHMFTTFDFGRAPGDTETPAVTNTAKGIQFTVTGLSPISVGWTKTSADPGRPSHSSGGGSRDPSYAVNMESSSHGNVTSNRTSSTSGSLVTLTVTPDRGYVLDKLTVIDSRGNEIKLTAQSGGKYTFPMPDRAVTVKASFALVLDGWRNPYQDVAPGAWYYEAVQFVTENDLMDGYGDGLFGPDNPLSRAQFVQILYNREDRPVAGDSMQFEDVPSGAWYAEAVRWAAGRGVAEGYGDGRFGPNDSITREQLAVLLWRYMGSPAATEQELGFADADTAGGYALEALRWAVENGVIKGKDSGTLEPKGFATRAQAAQIFMNFLKK